MRRSLGLLAGVPILLAACGAGPSDDPAGRSAAARPAPAHAAAGVRLVKVGSFDHPLYVTAPPGDHRRLFVVEETGRIRVIRDGRKLATPFLDLRNQVSCCDERGLLSMAFAPDYATSRRFYVYYTARNGDIRVVEFRRSGSPDRGVKASARLVLLQRHPAPNHNGGLVLFGPDNLMYVGLGDGGGGNDRHGSRGNAQSLGTVLGKLLRIDPRASGGRAYTVPGDNPFVGRSGVRSEIYAYGLRNPWRFSFDRANGDITIADVGQAEVEEVDFAQRGGARGVNYGWRVWEGRRRNYPGEQAPGAVFPVLTYTHAGGACSITGGYIVRDPRLPALAGQYVYGDYCVGRLRAVRLSAGRARGDHAIGVRVPRLSSFGEDTDGRVYATSLNGPVYRLAAG
ncbi:MAG TPA: PQQ-dependent sugar dehydrogenase [Solirubrobacteraceae bacterium]|jgi:glucose/arabinose dehydrogenase|nr:PQQ-dependent sugar dehydrogenase [Solirubrobacteraceae bacterium]